MERLALSMSPWDREGTFIKWKGKEWAHRRIQALCLAQMRQPVKHRESTPALPDKLHNNWAEEIKTKRSLTESGGYWVAQLTCIRFIMFTNHLPINIYSPSHLQNQLINPKSQTSSPVSSWPLISIMPSLNHLVSAQKPLIPCVIPLPWPSCPYLTEY